MTEQTQPDRLATTLDALCATLHQFEQSFNAQNAELSTRIDRITATVADQQTAAADDAKQRVAALEAKVSELETRNSELETRIQMGAPFYAPADPQSAIALNARRAGAEESLRKTLPPSLCAVLAKSATTDLDAAGHFDSAALDQALTSLSLEQRIAVKAEMARAGLLA